MTVTKRATKSGSRKALVLPHYPSHHRIARQDRITEMVVTVMSRSFEDDAMYAKEVGKASQPQSEVRGYSTPPRACPRLVVEVPRSDRTEVDPGHHTRQRSPTCAHPVHQAKADFCMLPVMSSAVCLSSSVEGWTLHILCIIAP